MMIYDKAVGKVLPWLATDYAWNADNTVLTFKIRQGVKAVQAVAHQWTCRGPVTTLTPAFLRHTGAHNLPDLLSGLMDGRYSVEADTAPPVFQAAADGDGVAIELIHWAGSELGELA
jgi:N-acetylglucosamine kinase-like BadF-type ATPase